ncbi:hypothetical protein H8356DRAFT_1325978 [Neocallimastix lanati (nom. inval.)]|nr:hypothetical protein H8356DRAFT_1325978 [Neocallimastix sp. JGI-2020a]
MKNKNDNLYIIIFIHLVIIYKYLFDSIVYEFGTKQIDTLKPLRSIDGLNILLNLNIPLPETLQGEFPKANQYLSKFQNSKINKNGDFDLGFKPLKENNKNNYLDMKCPFTDDIFIRDCIIIGVIFFTKIKRVLAIRHTTSITKNFPAHISPTFICIKPQTVKYSFIHSMSIYDKQSHSYSYPSFLILVFKKRLFFSSCKSLASPGCVSLVESVLIKISLIQKSLKNSNVQCMVKVHFGVLHRSHLLKFYLKKTHYKKSIR